LTTTIERAFPSSAEVDEATGRGVLIGAASLVRVAAGSYDDFGSEEAISHHLVDLPLEDEKARIAEIKGIGCCASAYKTHTTGPQRAHPTGGRE
jgi:hypothetical protein